jgi:hypothetical protein
MPPLPSLYGNKVKNLDLLIIMLTIVKAFNLINVDSMLIVTSLHMLKCNKLKHEVMAFTRAHTWA